MVHCRIISLNLLKDLIIKPAEILVMKTDSVMVNRGTRTYVTTLGKQFVYGCVNYGLKEHRECKLPYGSGFCADWGAVGFDTAACIYPHGVEHDRMLGRSSVGGRDEYMYFPLPHSSLGERL